MKVGDSELEILTHLNSFLTHRSLVFSQTRGAMNYGIILALNHIVRARRLLQTIRHLAKGLDSGHENRHVELAIVTN